MKHKNRSAPKTQQHRFFDTLESRVLLSTTYFVDINSPGPTHDGLSWATAFINPQQALAVAGNAGPGDQIHVADGTYTPTSTTDSTISFQLKNGVSLMGGYAGFGAVPNPDARDVVANETILSGEIGALRR